MTDLLTPVNKKIVILGYYNRHNLGDDLFAFIFEKLIATYYPNADLQILNTDDVEALDADVDIVICGGGDILNAYFIGKIRSLVESVGQSIPVYAIGVGIPYPNMIEEGAFDFFDFVIHRNGTEHQRLVARLGENRVVAFPDLGFLLPQWSNAMTLLEPYSSLLNMGYASGSGSGSAGSGSVGSGNCLKLKLGGCGGKNVQKNIGVFLSRTIYHPSDPSAYAQIIDQIASFLSKLAAQESYDFAKAKKVPDYQIFLIPSCTNDSFREDDRIINREVFGLINEKYAKQTRNWLGKKITQAHSNVHLVTEEIQITQIMSVFSKFYMTVCTRFHPHIFSLLANVPFVSLYTSNKVDNLLNQAGLLSWGVKMPVEPEFLYPLELGSGLLDELFSVRRKSFDADVNLLHILQERYREECMGLKTYFKNLMFTPVKKLVPGSPAFEERVTLVVDRISNILVNRYLINQNGLSIDDPLVVSSLSRLNNGAVPSKISDLVAVSKKSSVGSNGVNTDLMSDRNLRGGDLRGVDLTEQAAYVSEVISFLTSGDRYSAFLYGLKEQVLSPTYNLRGSVAWIRNEIEKAKSFANMLDNPLKIKYRCFNFEYFNQHLLCGYHRSGWEYVMNNLKKLHNPRGVIFDGFLDKTFGWSSPFLKETGFLPYKHDWVGIFHHTPDQSFSTNNLAEALKSPELLQSLLYCRGIFVLSIYLKNWLSDQLQKMGFEGIFVDSLVHPTELVEDSLKFSWSAFEANQAKKVVQIGAWMRDTYGIYRLGKPKQLKKVALRGREMNNYFPREGDVECVVESIMEIGCSAHCNEAHCHVSRHCHHNNEAHCHVSRHGFHGPLNSRCYCNKYLVGMAQMIEDNHHSVEVIENLNNSDYDTLLTQNVVFIQLLDASAVNTIIECIVRATPILVNRLPAVEEYLGSDYPLYYDSYERALEILNDSSQIKAGHEFLKKIDISRFHMKHFIEELLHSRIFQGIVDSEL